MNKLLGVFLILAGLVGFGSASLAYDPPPTEAPGPSLLMMHNPSCVFCQAFMRDFVGDLEPKYEDTVIGKQYPLIVLNMKIRPPQWVIDAFRDGRLKRIKGTPTFVLWDGGKEFGSIVGYGGRNQFIPAWGALVEKFEKQFEKMVR